jgi:hypothetical protein
MLIGDSVLDFRILACLLTSNEGLTGRLHLRCDTAGSTQSVFVIKARPTDGVESPIGWATFEPGQTETTVVFDIPGTVIPAEATISIIAASPVASDIAGITYRYT